MTTRLERRAKRQFEKQGHVVVRSQDPVVRDAQLAALAYRRADAWAHSPVGTPYGAVVVVKAVSHGR